MPARTTTSTTADTSLYASGISSARVRFEAQATVLGPDERDALYRKQASLFSQFADAYLRERSTDLDDVIGRIQLNLRGTPGPDPVVGWEDDAVDPLRLGDYLREFQKLVDRYGYRTSLYGHFGDGCIHARINFELRTPEGQPLDLTLTTNGSVLARKAAARVPEEPAPALLAAWAANTPRVREAILDAMELASLGTVSFIL